MLKPGSIRAASAIADECIDKIMFVRSRDGTYRNRPMEQISLIGEFILTAIAAVQAEDNQGGESIETATD